LRLASESEAQERENKKRATRILLIDLNK